MAIYSRESAARVIERREVIGDFSALDAAGARALAARFGLDYLVIDRDIELPLVHQEGIFRAFQLK
jgi:2-keto-3-deoxy-L-rhamnonate aldolase RhmA